MQASKKESYIHENVIFDSEDNENTDFAVENGMLDIMDIPGTAHDKIAMLANMDEELISRI